MNIVYDDPAGLTALRAFLRAGTTITDAELTSAWNAAVDGTQRWIRSGYTTDAPEGVQQFVLNVAAHIWRTRDSGGELQAMPDGTITGSSITSNLIRRYAVLGGPYVVTPRVIA